MRRLRLLPSLALVAALAATSAAAEPPRVALLVPGLANDGAFNQAAREAAEALAAEGLLTVELREEMADPSASEPVIRQYAAQGYDLIIGHGIELSDPILSVASAYPDIRFAASGGLDLRDRLQPNVNGWTYDFAQLGYLGGFIAARLNGVDTIGAVGGPELPFIAAAHAGFKAAVAEHDPAITILEAYTGSFDDAQVAAEVTRGLIAQGADAVWTSGDGIGNGVAAAADQAGSATLGVTGEAGGAAPRVNIASVVLDMTPTYRQWVADLASGEFGGDFYISGIGNGGLVATPLNPVRDLVPEGLGAEVDSLVEGLASGSVTLPQF